MATILWLDDRPHEREQMANALRRRGHSVLIVSSEDAAIAALEAEAPDLLIQDLHRPRSKRQTVGLPNRAGPRTSHEAGWSFYEEVLRPHFANLPVVICSVDAEVDANRKRADDYNLDLIGKSQLNTKLLVMAVDRLLAAQRLILPPRTLVPGIVTLDLTRVNSALLRHLSAVPEDIHRVSWASFEDLVARLLKELGYEVSRTRLTRDGGVDIWAIQRTDLGETLFAIDAKKYSPDCPIGPEPVRAIYGVADMAGASVGMIVTTSSFGPEARSLANQYRYRVSLKDCDDVQRWIKQVIGRETT